MAFGLVITGHFVNLIIFTSLIIIHEIGHIIISKILSYKMAAQIHLSKHAEFLQKFL